MQHLKPLTSFPVKRDRGVFTEEVVDGRLHLMFEYFANEQQVYGTQLQATVIVDRSQPEWVRGTPRVWSKWYYTGHARVDGTWCKVVLVKYRNFQARLMIMEYLPHYMTG